ncbi:MAG: sulfite exporter TauE/SafE family protein [Pelomonas sp.]|nr:sulfite exporter TauE/SafE family protein [Roseateles sp.]
MEAAIIASTFALGLAGAPHCTAMCAAPCAALIGREGGVPATLAFHATRAAGYAAAGAVAAGGLAAFGALAGIAPVLRPLWTLVHVAFFALGLWLLWRARQPQWLAVLGRRAGPAQAASAAPVWQPLATPSMAVSMPASMALPASAAPRPAVLRAGLAGSLWFAWPCGLLQSALLVSALANGALGGAAAMLAFAAASSAGLVAAPFVWRRLGRGGSARAERWALRAAGAAMAAMSGWALTSGLWHRVAEACAAWLS